MDGLESFYSGIIGTSKTTVLNKEKVSVVKLIMLGNSGNDEVTVTLEIDNALFNFKVGALETKVLDYTVICNNISIIATNNVNVHVSGISE